MIFNEILYTEKFLFENFIFPFKALRYNKKKKVYKHCTWNKKANKIKKAIKFLIYDS